EHRTGGKPRKFDDAVEGGGGVAGAVAGVDVGQSAEAAGRVEARQVGHGHLLALHGRGRLLYHVPEQSPSSGFGVRSCFELRTPTSERSGSCSCASRCWPAAAAATPAWWKPTASASCSTPGWGRDSSRRAWPPSACRGRVSRPSS